jgi:hypothetical protein
MEASLLTVGLPAGLVKSRLTKGESDTLNYRR